MTVRELGPDLSLSRGGDSVQATALPLWRQAMSARMRDLAWCTLSPPLLASLPGACNGDARLARWPAGTQAAWQQWLQQADPADLPATLAELANGVTDSL